MPPVNVRFVELDFIALVPHVNRAYDNATDESRQEYSNGVQHLLLRPGNRHPVKHRLKEID